MSRKRKELPVLEYVEITGVAAEGKALAKVDNVVLFVPYAVPGDIVDVRVTRKKHRFMEGTVVRFHQQSPLRTKPVCPHYGVCGGCKWQCLPYEEQIRWKQRQVMDNLEHIGKIELPECSPILGSEQTEAYRNKLEFSFANKVWKVFPDQHPEGLTPTVAEVPEDAPGAVGFHAGGAFDKILPIQECHLMAPVNDRIRNGIRDYCYREGLSFHDAREHIGLMRSIVIRLSNSGELMLLVQFCIKTEAEQTQAMALMEWIRANYPEVTSLLWVNNEKFNDTFGDLPVHTYAGTDHIFLEMENLRFKVGPKSFYQTNTRQAYILYKVARQLAGLTGNELVYDLYTGTGTIANFVAKQARKVIGIEYVPEAIEDAKVNSELNSITNTDFFAGDMKDILNRDFIEKHGRPDVIITDPPRAGMHEDVINTILFANPKRIVYVSCNPATQARDLQLLDAQYRVAHIQPVDMFPHTQHVENVVLLGHK